jgi:hypothetical protein
MSALPPDNQYPCHTTMFDRFVHVVPANTGMACTSRAQHSAVCEGCWCCGGNADMLLAGLVDVTSIALCSSRHQHAATDVHSVFQPCRMDSNRALEDGQTCSLSFTPFPCPPPCILCVCCPSPPLQRDVWGRYMSAVADALCYGSTSNHTLLFHPLALPHLPHPWVHVSLPRSVAMMCGAAACPRWPMHMARRAWPLWPTGCRRPPPPRARARVMHV